jgi:Spy/CpxP family protein refolding chaperone
MNGKVKAGILLVCMYGLGLITGAVWQSRQGGPKGKFRQAVIERKVQRLTEELKLTPEQEQSVRDIFKDASRRARQVNEEVRWDLQDIHRDSVTAIRGILTPEQQEKFEQLHKRLHDRKGKKHFKEGGAPKHMDRDHTAGATS